MKYAGSLITALPIVLADARNVCYIGREMVNPLKSKSS